ncbi:hypothetical protein LDENG_00088970, partial [Lucifuga dentata]
VYSTVTSTVRLTHSALHLAPLCSSHAALETPSTAPSPPSTGCHGCKFQVPVWSISHPKATFGLWTLGRAG